MPKFEPAADALSESGPSMIEPGGASTAITRELRRKPALNVLTGHAIEAFERAPRSGEVRVNVQIYEIDLGKARAPELMFGLSTPLPLVIMGVGATRYRLVMDPGEKGIINH